MSNFELTDNLTFIAATQMLERLAASGLLTAEEVKSVRGELERRMRPTI